MCSFAQKAAQQDKNTKPSLRNEEWGRMQTSSIMSDVSCLKGHLVGNCKKTGRDVPFVFVTSTLYLSPRSK